MFYPEASLKRGGKFYLCWVADSWPLRFASITERQLWSQDVRTLCDDLLEVMTNESGRATKRFSLRLSSQLLRGLVRFYHRKVDVFLGNLCMINATVIRKTNKKWQQREPSREQHPRQIPLITIEEPGEEPNLEELIQTSSNIVANIDDITMKEPTLEANQFLINDGFGELRSDLAHSSDKTIEMMMQADTSAAQHSAIDLPADFSAERSHDKSRLAPHDTAQMERVSEHDITMFRKSIGSEFLTVGDERDIPEIPEIPPPDLNAPQPMVHDVEVPAIHEPGLSPETATRQAREEVTLEELEEMPQPKRRRLRNKLIVDKNIKLSSKYLRSRIDNIALELRCERVEEDVIEIKVPAAWYFTRQAHGGARLRPNTSPALWSMFSRNLGVCNRPKSADRETEIVKRTSAEPNVSEQGMFQMLDISELPTQIVETMSQAMRRADQDSQYEVPAKKARTEDQMSYRRSEQLQLEASFRNNYEAEKENIPQNTQIPTHGSQSDLIALLQEAGLANVPSGGAKEMITETTAPVQNIVASDNRNDNETPLGSLDRTKVSLGDSDDTTESIKFIRDQWGTEGTMTKILKTIRLGVKPLTIRELVRRGPVIPGHLNIIIARCFTSVLKLKQHGFVKLQKDPVSLEIVDITLSSKFYTE